MAQFDLILMQSINSEELDDSCRQLLHLVYPVSCSIWGTLSTDVLSGVPCRQLLYLEYTFDSCSIWSTLSTAALSGVPCQQLPYQEYPVNSCSIWSTLSAAAARGKSWLPAASSPQTPQSRSCRRCSCPPRRTSNRTHRRCISCRS